LPPALSPPTAIRGRVAAEFAAVRGRPLQRGDSEWSPALDYSLGAHLRDLEAFADHLDIARFSWSASR
jgi:hypothetical protein